jgi:hypothetical protein
VGAAIDLADVAIVVVASPGGSADAVGYSVGEWGLVLGGGREARR